MNHRVSLDCGSAGIASKPSYIPHPGTRERSDDRETKGRCASFRQIVLLLLVVACGAACNTYSGPELALEAYARAVEENRCDEALKLVSERTRYAIDVLRVKPQHPQSPLLSENYYCNKLTFEHCKLGEMTLSASQADTATVSMPCGRTQDSFLPGFSSVFLKYEPRTTDLVREEGGWRVVVPMAIRIVDIREREEQLRDAELRRQEEFKRRRTKTSAPVGDEPH